MATATVCAKLGLECVVYMGAEDIQRQVRLLSCLISYLLMFSLIPSVVIECVQDENDGGYGSSCNIGRKDFEGCYQ